MQETQIYISVTRGNETLTLDGALYLFKEFLATLNDKDPQEVKELSRPAIDPPTQDKHPIAL